MCFVPGIKILLIQRSLYVRKSAIEDPQHPVYMLSFYIVSHLCGLLLKLYWVIQPATYYSVVYGAFHAPKV